MPLKTTDKLFKDQSLVVFRCAPNLKDTLGVVFNVVSCIVRFAVLCKKVAILDLMLLVESTV